MRKLKPREVPEFKRGLLEAQGGRCVICEKSLGTELSKMALDHDHTTGEIRGLLHLGCNKVEGVVFNALARWGGLGKDYDAVVPALERLLTYLKSPGAGVIYHLHKTPEELRELQNLRRRKAYARNKANQIVKGK